MHKQILEYKVVEKIYLRVAKEKSLNVTTGPDYVPIHFCDLQVKILKSFSQQNSFSLIIVNVPLPLALTESRSKAVPVNVLKVYRADQWYISIYYQPRQKIQMRGKFTLHRKSTSSC
jgi:hypothetical protein